MTSSEKEYCFKNAPEDIEEEIVIFEPRKSCTEIAERILCNLFSGSCDIEVNYNSKYVRKREKYVILIMML